MKYLRLFILSAIIGVMSVAAAAQDWQSLTPNNSLDGWSILSGEWRVTEDGVIVGKAPRDGNAWLLYEKNMFSDFEIALEFKTPAPTNGGVQVRSHWLPRMPLKDGETVADAPKQMHGYQVNVETRKQAGEVLIQLLKDKQTEDSQQTGAHKPRRMAVAKSDPVHQRDSLCDGTDILPVRREKLASGEPRVGKRPASRLPGR